MANEPEVSVEQLRELLEVFKKTLELGSDLARRVDLLEKASKETFTVLNTLQENQQRLLEAFQTQSGAQNTLNSDFAKTIGQMIERLDLLEGKRLVM